MYFHSRERLTHGRAALVCLAATLCFGGQSRAQSPPDAGSLLQQIERQQHPELPAKAKPLFVPPPAMQSLGQETVVVKDFRFAGNSLLSNAQLAPVVASFKGRKLNFNELQNAAIAVATAYRKAGWVVRAYLPQQDITSGTVIIQIVEAKFGGVKVEGSTRVTNSRVTRGIESAQRPGQPLNADAMDRGLLLLNDLPGVTAEGRLEEGQAQGETDLAVKVGDGPIVTGNVQVDNAGERSTGITREMANVSLNSPFGLGDRVDAMLLHSLGSDYERAAYSQPVGSAGWRVGVNASQLNYHVVTADLAALELRGTSTTVGAEASYPLIRARLDNLYFSFALDDKRFDNKSNRTLNSAYSVRVASLGLNGNLFDSFHGGGANNASLTFEQGNVDLAGSPSEAVDTDSIRADGVFSKLHFSAARLQTITDRFSLYGGLSGQWVSKNVDSSERLYLGGSTAIRAYPENEGGGSEGLLLNLEARERLPLNFNLVGFFDIGSVEINKDNEFAGAAHPNTDTLKGIGVSAGWTAHMGFNIQASFARRIGHNPDPTSTGTDQDGSLDLNRIWLLASVPFSW